MRWVVRRQLPGDLLGNPSIDYMMTSGSAIDQGRVHNCMRIWIENIAASTVSIGSTRQSEFGQLPGRGGVPLHGSASQIHHAFNPQHCFKFVCPLATECDRKTLARGR